MSTFSDERLRTPRVPVSSPNHVVAYWLKRDIIRGVFEPGERLKVDFLTRFYGIGHSPVREAILYLSAGGLVAHEHQKGHRVAPVSLEDYRDSFNIFDRVRRLALSMAMERGTDEWEERVIIQLHRSRKVPHILPSGDPEERERWQRAYGDFYDTLISGCGSALLIQFYSDLVARAERYTNLASNHEADHVRDHSAEHGAVVDAVLARDAERMNQVIDDNDIRARPMRRSIIEALSRAQQ